MFILTVESFTRSFAGRPWRRLVGQCIDPSMLGVGRFSTMVALGLLVVTGGAHAGDSPVTPSAPPKITDGTWFEKMKSAARNLLTRRTETEVWLANIQEAAQKLNYSGTFVYQQGDRVQASRITHFVDESGEHEKLELLDGQPREFIRNGDDVRCYLPQSKRVLQEKRIKSDTFPALLTGAPTGIDAWYKFERTSIERVAGRICSVVTLAPRDTMRYGYRLWSDQQTGLLLKAQTLNEHGEVIEQVAFTDLSTGAGIDKSRVQPSIASLDGWRTEKFETTPANLTGEGWTVRTPVLGFRKILEVRRMLEQNHEVGQIVYSDGLATISIFVEPARAKPPLIGDANEGPINIVSKRHGGKWLTVVGEAPVASIHQIADSIEFNPPK